MLYRILVERPIGPVYSGCNLPFSYRDTSSMNRYSQARIVDFDLSFRIRFVVAPQILVARTLRVCRDRS